jgi:hypothetical protein
MHDDSIFVSSWPRVPQRSDLNDRADGSQRNLSLEPTTIEQVELCLAEAWNDVKQSRDELGARLPRWSRPPISA